MRQFNEAMQAELSCNKCTNLGCAHKSLVRAQILRACILGCSGFLKQGPILKKECNSKIKKLNIFQGAGHSDVFLYS